MKVIAKKNSITFDEKGSLLLTFKVDNWRDKETVKNIESDKLYRLDINEAKSKRSIEQNKLLWEIIDEIATFQAMDSIEIYCELLEMANASYEYICIPPQAEKQLQTVFRAIKFIKKVDINGKEGNMYKCYYGSSKMNVKEMNELIDKAISYGWELGMDMMAYERGY